MPGDIMSPDIQLARPKTSPGDSRPSTQKTDETEQEPYHVELLEYEWPDLPPIPNMKDAITRQRVSKGISYLLPIDKGKNSINNRYRIDLRAMFQEPYSTDDMAFDENKVQLSAHIHFDTNTSDTKWSTRQFSSIPIKLNSQSEKLRRLYARSAPAGGSRRAGLNLDNIRTRSSLYLPMKVKAHPEAQKLRKEVEKIICSVQEDGDDYDDDRFKDTIEDEIENTAQKSNTKSQRNVNYRESIGNLSMNSSIYGKPPRLKLTAEKFNSYEQLRKAKPPKPVIPEVFRSRFLSYEKNQNIWEWLHYGEEMTDFEYFLSVCG